MVVPYFLHLPRSHNETRDRFTSITCYISLFYFLKPDENCSAMQVLEDMHKCLDNPELSYVDDTMGLFIMLPRAMGSSSKATHKLSKAITSWRPGKLLPATPLELGHYIWAAVASTFNCGGGGAASSVHGCWESVGCRNRATKSHR